MNNTTNPLANQKVGGAVTLINAVTDASYYSNENRSSVQTCAKCFHRYKLGLDEEIRGAIDTIDGVKRNPELARWKYHKELKRKTYVCPNCGCECGIYIP